MAKVLMIQGTMSSAGKSLVVAGLCRVFRQDGYRVAPFKSQNMSNNSFVTSEGLEMGRAQVVQAEAAGIEPSVLMNPILLKPNGNMGSQVILNGEVLGDYSASRYQELKQSLLPAIEQAFQTLAQANDIIVIEGAGSPAEINLKEGDLVNMGMARLAKAPVLLVGDIDRGGVFAQLYGTIGLLDETEQSMIKGMFINKFRGDAALLTSGLTMIEHLTDKPVLGVLPMLDIDIEEEDSLDVRSKRCEGSLIDIAVIRYPRISNFTDLKALEVTPGIQVRYVESVQELGQPDLVILPGSKNTPEDLAWLRQRKLDHAIVMLSEKVSVLGICGGYQMLGERLIDEAYPERSVQGLGLLPVHTTFHAEKTRTRVRGRSLQGGLFAEAKVEGYEIHMGKSEIRGDAASLFQLENGQPEGCVKGLVYGTYLHGVFDEASCRQAVLSYLHGKRWDSEMIEYEEYRQKQYDLLAEAIREHLDMAQIYRIVEQGL